MIASYGERAGGASQAVPPALAALTRATSPLPRPATRVHLAEPVGQLRNMSVSVAWAVSEHRLASHSVRRWTRPCTRVCGVRKRGGRRQKALQEGRHSVSHNKCARAGVRNHPSAEPVSLHRPPALGYPSRQTLCIRRGDLAHDQQAPPQYAQARGHVVHSAGANSAILAAVCRVRLRSATHRPVDACILSARAAEPNTCTHHFFQKIDRV
jgi:hypothetical protein